MSDYFEITLLDEPKVEFGDDFICDDPKMGISVGGFFSQSNNSHKNQINIAVISTEQLVVDTLNWIKGFENRIIAKETMLAEKYLTVRDGEITDEDDIDGVIIRDNEDIQHLMQQEINKVINKKYNPDFLGFSKETSLNCVFQNNEGNNRHIKQREFNKILDDSDLTQLEKLDKVLKYLSPSL